MDIAELSGGRPIRMKFKQSTREPRLKDSVGETSMNSKGASSAQLEFLRLSSHEGSVGPKISISSMASAIKTEGLLASFSEEQDSMKQLQNDKKFQEMKEKYMKQNSLPVEMIQSANAIGEDSFKLSATGSLEEKSPSRNESRELISRIKQPER